MSVKLFVGGLAWKTRTDGLKNAFSSFGVIEDAVVVMERDSDRSRGFGFVTFDNAESAEAAIKAMNGAELDGRRLRVNKTEDRPQKKSFRRGGNDRNRSNDRSRYNNDGSRRHQGQRSEGHGHRDQFRNRDRKPQQPVVDEINIPKSNSEEISSDSPVQDLENRSKWGKTARKSWGNKNRRRRDNDGEDGNERRKRRKNREEDDWNDW